MATSFYGGEFFGGEFFFGATPVVTQLGGHFLPRKKRKRDEYAERISARVRLRQQLADAFGTPEVEALGSFTIRDVFRDERLQEALGRISEEEDEDLLLLSYGVLVPPDDDDDEDLLLDG